MPQCGWTGPDALAGAVMPLKPAFVAFLGAVNPELDHAVVVPRPFHVENEVGPLVPHLVERHDATAFVLDGPEVEGQVPTPQAEECQRFAPTTPPSTERCRCWRGRCPSTGPGCESAWNIDPVGGVIGVQN